jgi:NADH dehydrogenase/NADH:ubiquinone oxidoreductase subunit G
MTIQMSSALFHQKFQYVARLNELSFAQTLCVQADKRRNNKERLRKRIWSGLNRGVGEDTNEFIWQQLKLQRRDMSGGAM